MGPPYLSVRLLVEPGAQKATSQWLTWGFESEKNQQAAIRRYRQQSHMLSRVKAQPNGDEIRHTEQIHFNNTQHYQATRNPEPAHIS